MKTTVSILASMAALLLSTAVRADCPLVPVGDEKFCFSVVFPTDPTFVELGGAVPIPFQLANYTDFDMTFRIDVAAPTVPGLSGLLHSVTLAPHTQASFTDVVLQPDNSTTLGIHEVNLGRIVTGHTAEDGDFVFNTDFPFDLIVVLPGQLREIIQLPCRWCVVEGSKQAEGRHPGETVQGSNLLKLLRRLNDEFWIPEAGILLRHASAIDGIPVIADPNPPDPNDPDSCCKLGDLASDDSLAAAGTEAGLAMIACEQAWSERYPGQIGIILVNGRLIDDGFTGGVAPDIPFEFKVGFPRNDDLCRHPRNLLVSDVTPRLQVVVYDQAQFPFPPISSSPKAEPVVVLAHEIAHTLMLGHGNGLDDNGDGLQPPTPGARRFDAFCDPLGDKNGDTRPDEDLLTTFTTCEETGSVVQDNGCKNLQPLQREMSREVAKLVPGAVITDPTLDPAGHLVAPPGACPPICSIPSDLVLQKVEMAETPERAITGFTHTVLLFPTEASNRYLVYADLDNDPLSGCGVSGLDLPGDFQGAELVTQVLLNVTGGIGAVTPTVWRCDAGTWIEMTDSGIDATAYAQSFFEDDPDDIFAPGIIAVQMPNSIRGPAGSDVRLQAVALGAGESDSLPADGAGGHISLIPPQLPTCSVAAPIARPGQVVAITASALPADLIADIFVGENRTGTASIGSGGQLDTDIVIPATSLPGIRTVEVLVRNSATSAVCAILIEGDALTPATTATLTPQPNFNEWNNTSVSVALNAVDVPGGPGIKEITHSATGAQPIAQTITSGAFVEFAIDTEGHTEISFFASNLNGVLEAANSKTVNLDKTLPTVEYAGNLSPYGILDTVHITCAAADSLSGVAFTTCEDINGPAYLFDPADNIFSATATDYADNVGSDSTSFSLLVTYDDLCVLTGQFIESSAHTPLKAQLLGSSLCAKLQSAQAAESHGNLIAKRKIILAYIKQVTANSNVVFSADQVQVLIKLARAL